MRTPTTARVPKFAALVTTKKATVRRAMRRGFKRDRVADLGCQQRQPRDQVLVAGTGDLPTGRLERRRLAGGRQRSDLILSKHGGQPPTGARPLVGSLEQDAAYVTGGGYQNYIDHSLQHWQVAYYGQNLPRLEAIRKHVDPDHYFNFPQAIGR